MRVKERKKTLQTNIKSNQIKSNKEINRTKTQRHLISIIAEHVC